MKTINIKGKEYVEVKERVKFLAENSETNPYSIETDYNYFPDRKMWVVKATLRIKDQVFTGLAQEVESDNWKEVNHTSALENAETSAVGRACAFAGIGIIDSIASVDEIRKAENRASYQPKTEASVKINPDDIFIKLAYLESKETWKEVDTFLVKECGAQKIKKGKSDVYIVANNMKGKLALKADYYEFVTDKNSQVVPLEDIPTVDVEDLPF